ncbi:MAG: hypothetical protein LC125_12470 [Burkholderiales bacterium]|nr:hypothetical protein [Burkholderiales bacterium]
MNLLSKTSLSTVTLALALLAGTAQAQTPPAPAASMPRVDARQARQEARIGQGAASGALTPHEQRRLQREQRAITKAETKAEADGTVTAQERRKLHRMQDAASRDIHHQKHDRQHMPGAASAPKP